VLGAAACGERWVGVWVFAGGSGKVVPAAARGGLDGRSRAQASLVGSASHCARAIYCAGIMFCRSVNSAELSGEALNERHTGAGSSGVTANIFPLTLNTRS